MLPSSGSMGTRQLWTAAAVTLLLSLSPLPAAVGKEHTRTFWSPVFELGPGDVTDHYKVMEFPTGHIAMRNFHAEVVDEEGTPVPLYETYLHHWVALRFFVKKGHTELLSSVPKVLPASSRDGQSMRHSERIAFQEGADLKEVHHNQGSCLGYESSVVAMGSETRHTNRNIPAPYGQVLGDPKEIPEGYEEIFIINVHAIDTRGAVDATSCIECLCESYGVTTDAHGKPLGEGYIGGLVCCPDKAHCAVKDYDGLKPRKLFLKYTVTWVDWDESVVPVRSYTLDVTDPRTSLSEEPHCKVEYDVPQCREGTPNSQCIDDRRSIGAVDVGGDLVLAVMHQHAGGLGGILSKKDGVVLCSSDPIYGKGTEPGDEVGYVVGMTTCYPAPGSIHLESMEELTVRAFYSNQKGHTGAMSLFFIQIADPIYNIAEM